MYLAIVQIYEQIDIKTKYMITILGIKYQYLNFQVMRVLYFHVCKDKNT